MGIILDPALFGLQGRTHEANAAIVKFNGTDVGKNSVVSITGNGINKEGVNNNFALGSRGLVSYTSGVVVPRDLTVTIYTAMAETIKSLISPAGNWLVDKFSITLQLDAPSSAFPGVTGLLSLPVLTSSIVGCEIIGTELGVEPAGGAIVDVWTIKPLRIDTPSGQGYT
jgi:hypothetical protein